MNRLARIFVLFVSFVISGCALPWVGRDDVQYEGIPNTAPPLPQAPYGPDQSQATIPESRQAVGIGNPPLCPYPLDTQFSGGRWSCVQRTPWQMWWGTPGGSSFFFWGR
ncbi:MAG TPA: hypothetical protein VJI70_00575 [Candidatus Paceibacterota bacterium]